jgi:hypothetical protein
VGVGNRGGGAGCAGRPGAYAHVLVPMGGDRIIVGATAALLALVGAARAADAAAIADELEMLATNGPAGKLSLFTNTQSM